MDENVEFRRTLGLWALIAFGIGDILGAGIYALVGTIAGIAGAAAWLAFAVAMGVAALTALSYAELSRRFPKSGGEAYFCECAFHWPSLSLLIGWFVFASGVVSLATVSRAFGDYFLASWPRPGMAIHTLVVLGFLLVLTGINFWGIRQSSTANIICTVVEASGLLIVLIVGFNYIMGNDDVNVPAVAAATVPVQVPAWLLITQGAALAFFAFIGFEDMVNVSEEVKDPERNLPRAIIISLLAAGTVYILVTWIATKVIPPPELAASRAPLLEVVRHAAPRFPTWLFASIALFAVANTGLLNYVMASRLLYGMARQRLLPAWVATLHPRTRTPHLAILVILCVAMVLALTGTIEYLAGTTSFLLLIVFTAVNVALIVLKWRERAHRKTFPISLVVPIVAVLASLGLMIALPPESIQRALYIMAIGVLLVIVHWAANRPLTAN